MREEGVVVSHSPSQVVRHVDTEKVVAAEELHASLARILGGEQLLAAWDGQSKRPESIGKCSCHIGHYSQPQLIANLLHIVVQLALFPNAAGKPQTEQACQTHEEMSTQTCSDSSCQAVAESVDGICQTIHETSIQTATETACQTVQEQATQAQFPEKREFYLTQAVRVGGGFHVVRSMRASATKSKHQNSCGVSTPPRQVMSPELGTASTDCGTSPWSGGDAVKHRPSSTTDDYDDEDPTDQELLSSACADIKNTDSYAHGRPGTNVQLERFKVGAYGEGEGPERMYRVMKGRRLRPHSARARLYPRVGGPVSG
eukprot:TRINITY_DN20595_c0_g1_i1.p1 TRINITY_DN20595_c0_g1~~TRINITY_DN20595_c0_g1_i1.p1  ORF type:complete len:326 (-),score=50.42 TRINITY_DN20595_c0_g1_i1:215-1159(-)